MTKGLEGIIRPFETSDIGPAKPAPVAASSQEQNVVINPGSNGQVKTFSGSFNLTKTFYYIKKPKEKQKQEA